MNLELMLALPGTVRTPVCTVWVRILSLGGKSFFPPPPPFLPPLPSPPAPPPPPLPESEVNIGREGLIFKYVGTSWVSRHSRQVVLIMWMCEFSPAMEFPNVVVVLSPFTTTSCPLMWVRPGLPAFLLLCVLFWMQMEEYEPPSSSLWMKNTSELDR